MRSTQMRSTHQSRRLKELSMGRGRAQQRSTKIIAIAQRNVSSVFDLAKSLAGAKKLTDIVELQAAYWRKQFDVLTAQAEEVRTLSTKVTADTAQSMEEHVARSCG
jgi:hypothetical protein